MDKTTSLYLDLLRFSAAILVLLSHSATFLDIYLPVLSDFGSEAVAVFFVLSGYVISYVVAKKEDNPASYFKARAFRIYSVLIPALIITFIFDHIGLSIDSSYYFAHKNFHNDYSFVTITQTLTFLGETLNRHIVFGTNEPIWSIQFECLYYIAFGAILFARKKSLLVLSLFIFILLATPKVIIYFPLWLLGVLAHKTKLQFITNKSLVFFPLSILLILIGRYVPFPHIPMYKEFHLTLTSAKSIFYFYSIGVMVAVNIVSAKGFLNGTGVANYLEKSEKIIRYLSSNTFTLYLTHIPVIMLLCVIIRPANLIGSILTLLLTISICFVASWCFENKKGPVISFLNKKATTK